ncbi:MAG: hypothetical protein QM770_16640 [Tepidisphaeraceae bacterium]
MTSRWETRYSSSEMMYLEIVGQSVKCYLNHSPGNADVWSFDEVLSGKMDSTEAGVVFGSYVMAELKATVQALKDGTAPRELTKDELREKRRREG